MTAPNFPPCQKLVLQYEGGYSNHPKDPGGVTLEGVIQTRYNEYRRDVGKPPKRLTPQMRYTPEWIAERDEIYKRYYWNVVKANTLHDGVDLAVYDYAVNSGPGRALAHFKPWAAIQNTDPIKAIKGLCARRMSFLRGLATWVYFGKGWGPRVVSVEANGVKMALKAQNVPAAEITKKLEAEASSAARTAKQQTTATATATGTAAAPSVDASTSTEPFFQFDLLLTGVTVVMVAAVLFLGYRAYVNYQRKQAYVAAAQS